MLPRFRLRQGKRGAEGWTNRRAFSNVGPTMCVVPWVLGSAEAIQTGRGIHAPHAKVHETKTFSDTIFTWRVISLQLFIPLAGESLYRMSAVFIFLFPSISREYYNRLVSKKVVRVRFHSNIGAVLTSKFDPFTPNSPISFRNRTN